MAAELSTPKPKPKPEDVLLAIRIRQLRNIDGFVFDHTSVADFGPPLRVSYPLRRDINSAGIWL
jgi:hypothetical protein